MPEEHIVTAQHLWDEITKVISLEMTHRLLPVINEAYDRNYPPDTPIRLLATEHSDYLDNPAESPSSKLMDIALLVNGTDYYHIESQMDNDHQMVIRMIAYDLHFAIQHSTERNTFSGEIILHFPQSIVIYPDPNSSIPDKLQCRLIFPDKSQHIYQLPTVRIQAYGLKEIREKHLDFFIPFTLLRFRPLLERKRKKLTCKELTDFVQELIVILETEVEAGTITPLESGNYISLLQRAAEHIFQKYPKYYEEVCKVTKPSIKVPSMVIRELQQTITEKDAAITEKDAVITEKNAAILKMNEARAQDKARIILLEQQLAALRSTGQADLMNTKHPHTINDCTEGKTEKE